MPYVTMAVILKEPHVLQRDNHMPKRGLSTSMGIALTLLIAGITVQVTDNLELFGHNSFIPLIIGLVIIFVGVSFFLIRRQITKGRQQ
jgi:uncharacterized protein YacL